MYIIEDQKKDRILEIANHYAEKWLTNKNLKYIDLLKNENQFSKLFWNSPENIESGLSGVALFFISTYKATSQKQYFDVAKGIINEMILYCKSNPTNNYSLFTGRCGVVYTILQLYDLNKDIQLLHQAVDIIKTAKTNCLNSEYVNDSLYEGRAGTLLILFHLYKHINEPGILEDIYLFTEKIIDNIKLSDAGIYWEAKEELNIKPLVGFAKGTVGIRYVFNQINEILPDDLLAYLNTKLALYENSCWIEEFGNWGNFNEHVKFEKYVEEHKLTEDQSKSFCKPINDFCWADGTTGLGYPRLFNKEGVSLIIEILYGALAGNQVENNSLYNGLAGIGCFFLEASKQFTAPNYFEVALEIGDKILADLYDKKDLNDDFFHGDIGQLYFLLSLINPEAYQAPVLCPSFKGADEKTLELQRLKVSVISLRQRLMEKYFPRTCQILQRVTPVIYQEFFNRAIDYNYNEINDFILFIDRFLLDISQSPLGPPLIDLFNLEKNKYEFLFGKEGSKAQVYIQEFIRHGKVIELINKLGNNLLDVPIKRSDKIKKIATKWNWSVVDKSFRKRDIIHNLLKKPESFETILIITERNEVIENTLGNEEPFCWHWFKNESTARHALNEITSYYSQTDHEQMEMNISRFGSKNVSDFLSHVQILYYSKIKEWLYDGILIIVQ